MGVISMACFQSVWPSLLGVCACGIEGKGFVSHYTPSRRRRRRERRREGGGGGFDCLDEHASGSSSSVVCKCSGGKHPLTSLLLSDRSEQILMFDRRSGLVAHTSSTAV